MKWLGKLPKKLKVADFGCGDAALARMVKQKVVSLDLVSSSPDVVACNMSDTPLGRSHSMAHQACLIAELPFPCLMQQHQGLSRLATESAALEECKPLWGPKLLLLG